MSATAEAVPGAGRIAAVLRADPVRWQLLDRLHDCGLDDAWIGAGFVRDAVWDHLHGFAPEPNRGDVDVVWHDPAHMDREVDRDREARLRQAEPTARWSVKNQARMHLRNGDAPYATLTDALNAWPDTATAVAVRRVAADECCVLAPFGVADLFGLVLRPTPAFAAAKRAVFEQRIARKGWLQRWPRLRIAAA